MYPFDLFVQNYFSATRTPFFTEFYYLLTILFDLSFSFILISVLISALIYMVRGVKFAILFLTTILVGGISVYILKFIFNIARPVGGAVDVFGKSFPSGHTAISTIFFVMLIYIFDSYLSRFWKIIFNSLCVIGLLLVAFSRVYLGVHWVSDLIGGFLWGIAVSYIAIVVFRKN